MYYTHCYESGKLAIALQGEIDHHGVKTARTEIDILIDKYAPDHLILDLSGIIFCDSSGLGFLMGRYKKINEKKGKMYIYNPSEAVKKIMYLSGMDKLIKIHEKKA